MFTGLTVGREVAQVVDHQDSDDDQADRQRHAPGSRADPGSLHEVGACHAGHPEEQEYEQVAQPVIAQRERPTGVGNRREDGRHSNQEHNPAGCEGQVQADQPGQGEHAQHAGLDLGRTEQPRLGDTQRAVAAGRIGAALVIENVIGQIAADLQEQRHQQRGQRRKRAEDAVMQSQSTADKYAGRSGRQGERPNGQPPDLEAIGKGGFRIHNE